jgi:hypothetical protein
VSMTGPLCLVALGVPIYAEDERLSPVQFLLEPFDVLGKLCPLVVQLFVQLFSVLETRLVHRKGLCPHIELLEISTDASPESSGPAQMRKPSNL